MVAELTAPSLGAQRNDDALGHAVTSSGLCAWIIDGSTSVADEDYVDGENGDAAWFANALSRALAERASDDLALRELHAVAAAAVATAYEELVMQAPARPPLFAQPTAAISIVRTAASTLELFQLGDCSVFAWNGRSAKRLSSGGGLDDNNAARSRITALQAAHGGSRAVWEQERTWERARRDARMRQPRLNVSTPSAEDRFEGWSASIDLDGFKALTLMSDGLERFVAEFGLGDETEMVRRLLIDGPDRVLNDVRAVEAADLDCRRFPRVKASDDASCLIAQRPS